MSTISWIAAYPRSGSTWLRFLLAHVLTGHADSSMHVANTIWDLHKPGSIDRLANERSAIVKTHFPFSHDHPFFERTTRCIVLIRHPLDVVVSVANYVCRQGGLDLVDVPPLIDRFSELFANTGGLPYDAFWSSCGRWDENVRSWLEQDEFPTRLVRYEDLVKDPARELGSIVRFLWPKSNVTATPGFRWLARRSDIRRAVGACSNAKMTAIESREVSEGRQGMFTVDTTGTPKLRFINRATPDQWQAVIRREKLARIRNRHSHELARYGYSV